MVLERDYLTPDEVGERLQVRGATVRRWVDAGRLTGYRVGGRIRIPHEALRHFVRPAFGESQPTPAPDTRLEAAS